MIHLQEVTKVFDRPEGGLAALKGVTLHILKGTFLSIMGPSGSGKSTLVNLIGGLDTPTAGEIVIDGQVTNTFSESDWDTFRGRRIGIVFQSFNLLPTLSIKENVALPLQLQGMTGHEVDVRTDRWLEAVGLERRRNHYPYDLSGGEQQRAAIARAMIHTPDILLADEPTGNLDSARTREIVGLMKDLAGSSGQTVVMVTHNRAAAHMADRVVVLTDGRVES